MRKGFVTAGTWCVDRNITVDQWPKEDMIAAVQKVELAGGGSGCNFAVDMRRLDPDMPVWTQGLIGAGEMGDFLIGIADEYGIDRSGLYRTADAQTQVTDAYVSAQTGRRTHILFFGVADLMTPDHYDFSTCSARVLHLGLPGIHKQMDAAWGDDANGWVTVLREAKAAGLKTNFEFVAGPEDKIRAVGHPCLPHLDTLVVNDFEIGALAGRKTVEDGVTDRDQVFAAAKEVLTMGAMELVAVHFTEGAVLVTRDGTETFQPSVRIADKDRKGANGAGDAFAAGFQYGLHEGWTGQDALKLGHAAAAACLRSVGTYTTVETAADCLALAQTWGWRD